MEVRIDYLMTRGSCKMYCKDCFRYFACPVLKDRKPTAPTRCKSDIDKLHFMFCYVSFYHHVSLCTNLIAFLITNLFKEYSVILLMGSSRICGTSLP